MLMLQQIELKIQWQIKLSCAKQYSINFYRADQSLLIDSSGVVQQAIFIINIERSTQQRAKSNLLHLLSANCFDGEIIDFITILKHSD